jgi:iron complex outermembrane receptor protein
VVRVGLHRPLSDSERSADLGGRALPNFHEHFITKSFQPFVEYEYKVTRDLSVTAGIKLANYGMNFTQFADNGKTVGSLGGAPSVIHDSTYRSWMPSLDARYKMKTNWTATRSSPRAA